MTTVFNTLCNDAVRVASAIQNGAVGETRKDAMLSGARLAGALMVTAGTWHAVGIILNGGAVLSLITHVALAIIGHDTYRMAQTFEQIRKQGVLELGAAKVGAKTIFTVIENRIKAAFKKEDPRVVEDIGSEHIATDLSKGTVTQKVLVYAHRMWTGPAMDFLTAR